MTSAYQYQQLWETKLAERLNKPQNWKETCFIKYMDVQTEVMPYIGTAGEPAVGTALFAAAGDRSTLTNVVPLVVITESSDTISIVTTDYDSAYVDYADQAQSQYVSWVDIGDLLARKIGERIESITLANYGSWTAVGDVGAGVVGLGSSTLTVSATNIDDIIRGVIQQIQTANGFEVYQREGGFITWRPADWNYLTQFMQSNGFYQADLALKDGPKVNENMGVPYMGLYHYVSTLHTAGHLMGGVRRVLVLGLQKTTYGKTYIAENPPGTNGGMLSGTAIHTRLDYGLKVPTNLAPVIYNINVA